MTSPHTLEYMRKEYFEGNGVTDAKSRDKWTGEGSQDAYTRARAIAKKILAQEEKSYISEEVDQAIHKKFDILL
jgi:trimethylamine--corrinoid protein Co-methyltransferase